MTRMNLWPRESMSRLSLCSLSVSVKCIDAAYLHWLILWQSAGSSDIPVLVIMKSSQNHLSISFCVVFESTLVIGFISCFFISISVSVLLDIDVDGMYECRRVASLPASSILQWYDSLETITSKCHFDLQFLEFRHDNRRLFPGSSKIYPLLF